MTAGSKLYDHFRSQHYPIHFSMKMLNNSGVQYGSHYLRVTFKVFAM